MAQVIKRRISNDHRVPQLWLSVGAGPPTTRASQMPKMPMAQRLETRPGMDLGGMTTPRQPQAKGGMMPRPRTTRTPVQEAVAAYNGEKLARNALDRAQERANRLVGALTPEEFQEYAAITLAQDQRDNEREEARLNK